MLGFAGMDPIAILVVHGTGAQQAGESARKLLAGLARVDRVLAFLIGPKVRACRAHRKYWTAG